MRSPRQRAVSYFSLQSYCTQSRKHALAERRIRQILREKADCKQSSELTCEKQVLPSQKRKSYLLVDLDQ